MTVHDQNPAPGLDVRGRPTRITGSNPNPSTEYLGIPERAVTVEFLTLYFDSGMSELPWVSCLRRRHTRAQGPGAQIRGLEQ